MWDWTQVRHANDDCDRGDFLGIANTPGGGTRAMEDSIDRLRRTERPGDAILP